MKVLFFIFSLTLFIFYSQIHKLWFRYTINKLLIKCHILFVFSTSKLNITKLWLENKKLNNYEFHMKCLKKQKIKIGNSIKISTILQRKLNY